MADVVNNTHKDRLAQRNSEPTHLNVVPSTDIGGSQGVDAEPNTAKVDGAKGVSTDTTIPKSVPAEKTHLGRVTGSDVNEDDASSVEVEFDGDVDAIDDLDEALDSFTEDFDVDIEGEDDEKEVKEDKDGDEDADDKEDIKEEDGDDDADDKDDDKKDKGDKFPAFLHKEDVEGADRGDSQAAIAANAKGPEAALNSGPNDVTEEDEDDDAEEKKLEEDGDNFGGDDDPSATEKNAKEPAAAMNESVKVRIKLPPARLFESAGVSKKSQKKVAMVFESVVRDVTKQISKQLNKHYKGLFESRNSKRDAVMAKQMDGYLNYVVEEWTNQNRVAIRKSLRAQLAEEFLAGLHSLFKEHYIDVPESKVDVVKQLTEEVTKLKKAVNEQTTQKMKLRKLAEAANKARIVAQFARGKNLSEAQVVKLEKLAEGTQYTSAKDFREKLGMLSESYFPKNDKKLKVLPEETVQEVKNTKTESVADPVVAAAMKAASAMSDTDKW